MAEVQSCIKCGHAQGGGNFCEVCGERFPEPLPAEPPASAAIPTAAAYTPPTQATPSPPPAAAPTPPPVQSYAPAYTEPQYTTPQYQSPPAAGPAGNQSYYVPPAVPPSAPRDDVWSGLFDFSFRRFPTPGLVRLTWMAAVAWVGLALIVAIWVISDTRRGGLMVFSLLEAIAVAVFVLAGIRVALEAALAVFRVREKKENQG